MSPNIFFLNCGVSDLKFWLSSKNGTPESGGQVYRRFQIKNYWSKKAQIWLKMITRRYYWWSMMSTCIYSRNCSVGVLQFCLSVNNGTPEGCGRVHCLFILQNNKEARMNASKEIKTCLNCKKGVQKLQKMAILANSNFSDYKVF